MFYDILGKEDNYKQIKGYDPLLENCTAIRNGVLLRRMLHYLCNILHAIHIRLYEFLRTLRLTLPYCLYYGMLLFLVNIRIFQVHSSAHQ